MIREDLEKKLDEAVARHQKEIEVARSEVKEADARKQEAVLRVQHLAYVGSQSRKPKPMWEQDC